MIDRGRDSALREGRRRDITEGGVSISAAARSPTGWYTPPPQTGASARGPYQQVVEGDKLSDALSWGRNVLTNKCALSL